MFFLLNPFMREDVSTINQVVTDSFKKRKTNFLIYNLPEPTGSKCADIDRKTVESFVQKNLMQR